MSANLNTQLQIARDLAKARAVEINAGKDPTWDALNRTETVIFVEAFMEGFQACLNLHTKKKPKSNES